MRPSTKYEAIRAELSREIEQGLAEVERDGDSVIIRLGQQDSFSLRQCRATAGLYRNLNQRWQRRKQYWRSCSCGGAYGQYSGRVQ